MGVDLKPIITHSTITISELSRKVVAVDAYNAIYQFLATIRGPTGELLTNVQWRCNKSFERFILSQYQFVADNIKLVYIFDGKPNPLKSKEIERRRQIKQKAS